MSLLTTIEAAEPATANDLRRGMTCCRINGRLVLAIRSEWSVADFVALDEILHSLGFRMLARHPIGEASRVEIVPVGPSAPQPPTQPDDPQPALMPESGDCDTWVLGERPATWHVWALPGLLRHLTTIQQESIETLGSNR